MYGVYSYRIPRLHFDLRGFRLTNLQDPALWDEKISLSLSSLNEPPPAPKRIYYYIIAKTPRHPAAGPPPPPLVLHRHVVKRS